MGKIRLCKCKSCKRGRKALKKLSKRYFKKPFDTEWYNKEELKNGR